MNKLHISCCAVQLTNFTVIQAESEITYCCAFILVGGLGFLRFLTDVDKSSQAGFPPPGCCDASSLFQGFPAFLTFLCVCVCVCVGPLLLCHVS